MASTKIRKDDIGTEFKITLYNGDDILPLSGLADKNFVFSKPNGEKLVKPASFITDGLDGGVFYRAVSGDIDTAGIWRMQVVLEYTNGDVWHSDIDEFKVFNNI